MPTSARWLPGRFAARVDEGIDPYKVQLKFVPHPVGADYISARGQSRFSQAFRKTHPGTGAYLMRPYTQD